MRTWSKRGFILALGVVQALATASAEAQIGNRIRSRVQNRVDQAVDRAVDKAVDAVVNPAAAGDPAAGSDVNGELKPGEGAWANYDFVPGERPLFVEDFATDRVGDFPRRLRMVRGAMEVVEWRGGRFLRVSSDSDFEVVLPQALPPRFTVEFDLYLPRGNGYPLELRVETGDDRPGYRGSGLRARYGVLYCGAIMSGVQQGDMEAVTRLSDVVTRTLVPCRFMVDGQHAKVYVADRRVANAPQVELGRTERLHFYVPASEGYEALIGNLRVMAGGLHLYTAESQTAPAPPAMADVLMEKGRVATQGILFATGQDRIRPESTPTLTEIAEVLRANPQLRLLIEGHTDNVGADAVNLTLSERRAAAVKTYLVTEAGIAPERLETKGYGEDRPVAPNDTPEGRQQNRRVELVRQ